MLTFDERHIKTVLTGEWGHWYDPHIYDKDKFLACGIAIKVEDNSAADDAAATAIDVAYCDWTADGPWDGWKWDSYDDPTEWGVWAPTVWCPEYQYINGMIANYEPDVHDGTGLNAIKIRC